MRVLCCPGEGVSEECLRSKLIICLSNPVIHPSLYCILPHNSSSVGRIVFTWFLSLCYSDSCYEFLIANRRLSFLNSTKLCTCQCEPIVIITCPPANQRVLDVNPCIKLILKFVLVLVHFVKTTPTVAWLR